MRVFLSTFGTDGDVVTFARLARVLRARGDAVTVCTWAMYEPWFPDGVTFVPAALDRTRGDLHAALDDALPMATPWLQIERFCRLFYGMGGGMGEGAGAARAQYARLREAMPGHDVALVNVLDHLGHAAADDARIPWATFASRTPPPPATDRALADVDRQLTALVTAAVGHEVPPVRTFRARSPHLDLVHGSPALLLPYPEEPTLKVTGSWLDPATAAPLPAHVAAFLDAGPALLIGFGTLPDVGGRTEALVAAARRTGWRVVVQVLPPATPPAERDGVCVVTERMAYGTLLPRVAAVVHHGGAGTVHEIVRAGRPSLAIPHMADQYYWARVVGARRLGPPPLDYRERAPAALDAAFVALRDARWRPQAEALAPVVAAERGLEACVRALEGLA